MMNKKQYTFRNFLDIKEHKDVLLEKKLLIKGFPFYRQKHDYTCGPAIFKSYLEYFGKNIDYQTLIDDLDTTSENGTLVEKFEEYMKKEKIKYKLVRNGKIEDVIKLVKDGIPVMTSWMDWGNHWVSVIGCYTKDKLVKERDTLILADPYDKCDGALDGMTEVPIDRFESMWWYGLYTKDRKMEYGIYFWIIDG